MVADGFCIVSKETRIYPGTAEKRYSWAKVGRRQWLVVGSVQVP